MTPTAAKNARSIQCRGCKEPLEIADATTLFGCYWCSACAEKLTIIDVEIKAVPFEKEPQQEKLF